MRKPSAWRGALLIALGGLAMWMPLAGHLQATENPSGLRQTSPVRAISPLAAESPLQQLSPLSPPGTPTRTPRPPSPTRTPTRTPTPRG
jgi:hypothetical protein